jgi:hypothetical protein
MRWFAPSEEDAQNAALEARLWNTTDQFRANSSLKSQTKVPQVHLPTARQSRNHPSLVASGRPKTFARLTVNYAPKAQSLVSPGLRPGNPFTKPLPNAKGAITHQKSFTKPLPSAKGAITHQKSFTKPLPSAKGAITHQPRATPWELVHQTIYQP